MSFIVPDDTVLVADGGLATELEARGNDLSDSLWSARLLLDAPDEIRDSHLAFFRAGAVIATSASYQASFEGNHRRAICMCCSLVSSSARLVMTSPRGLVRGDLTGICQGSPALP